MPTSLIIPGLILLGVMAGTVALFHFANSRGTRRRNRARATEDVRANHGGQRRTDARSLTGPEKRMLSRAKALHAEGKVQASARIYEQLNMQREAIQALEDAGMIHEAAKILIRMGKQNRAGVIYARHGMWMDAAAAFKTAQMPVEVAKCAREAGQHALAGEFFEKASRNEDAAESWERAGDTLRSGRLFLAVGNKQRALPLLGRFLSTVEGAAERLNDGEVDLICEHLTEGHNEPGFIDLIARKDRIADVVGALVAKGNASLAKDVFARSNSDIGPKLMAAVSYRDRSAENLAQLFLTVDHFGYAGMVFERMGSFERAGAAFEQADDLERAIYCYERAHMDDKVRPLQERQRRGGGGGGNAPARKIGQNAGFALADLPSETIPKGFADAPGDSTAVIDTRPVPPPPSFSLSADSGAAAEPRALPHEEKPDPAIAPNATADDTRPSVPPPPPIITRLSDDPGHPAFHRAKFLSDLDREQRTALWAIGHTYSFAEGEVVLTYDDEPKGVYIITNGTVACYRDVGGRETYVDQMGASETFGELWLLADQPTAVRFVAQAAAEIRVIGRDAFNELMDKDGTLARKVYKRFTMRLLKRLLRPQSPSKIQAAS